MRPKSHTLLCYVLIRGHVFDREEKAPFVRSGISLLGALEYDSDREKVRCHECGGWFDCISRTHLVHKHDGMSVREYKTRHGLNARTGLCTPAFSAMRRGQNKNLVSPESTALLIEAGREHKRLHGTNKSNRGAQTERSNTAGRCKAQIIFKLQMLAAIKQRTPTAKEMFEIGLDQPLVLKRFGNYEAMFKNASLTPRPAGKRVTDDYGKLPNGFPTENELLEARMPWPKDHARVQPFEQKHL